MGFILKRIGWTDTKTMGSAEKLLQDCKNTFSCDDLVWTIRAGVNAAALRGDATHGNLTAFLNTDRKRLDRQNQPFLPGCSVLRISTYLQILKMQK